MLIFKGPCIQQDFWLVTWNDKKSCRNLIRGKTESFIKIWSPTMRCRNPNVRMKSRCNDSANTARPPSSFRIKQGQHRFWFYQDQQWQIKGRHVARPDRGWWRRNKRKEKRRFGSLLGRTLFRARFLARGSHVWHMCLLLTIRLEESSTTRWREGKSTCDCAPEEEKYDTCTHDDVRNKPKSLNSKGHGDIPWSQKCWIWAREGSRARSC